MDAAREASLYFPIVVGGYSYRWFSVYLTSDDELAVSLNNQGYTQSSVQVVTLDEWHNLVATFSLADGELRVYLDNSLVFGYVLPVRFQLDVRVLADRNILFQNRSVGSAFQGWVDNLRVYRGVLPPP